MSDTLIDYRELTVRIPKPAGIPVAAGFRKAMRRGKTVSRAKADHLTFLFCSLAVAFTVGLMLFVTLVRA
jgi:hypothetical protein